MMEPHCESGSRSRKPDPRPALAPAPLAACLLALAALGPISGCSETAEEQASSFGHRIAEAREELRIDGHEELLAYIPSIAVSEDGTIAMGQIYQSTVLFFSQSGEPLGRFGRDGEGPGEFRRLWSFGWRADSLWVYDPDHRRITMVTPDLDLGRVTTITTDDVHVRALDPAGGMVFQRNAGPSAVWPAAIRRLSDDESAEELLLELPSVPQEEVIVQTSVGRVELPFANLPIAAYASDGSRVAGVMADLDGPDAGTFSLTAVGTDGRTLFGRRYSFDPEPLTRAAADSVVQEMVGPWEDMSPDGAAAVRTATRVPPLWPPLNGLLIGDDGSFWIEERVRGDLRTYYVVAADGEATGTFLLPAGNRLMAASLDRIWVAEQDALDVESLVRYGLLWD